MIPRISFHWRAEERPPISNHSSLVRMASSVEATLTGRVPRFQDVRLSTTRFFSREGAPFEGDQVHLQHSVEVDRIVGQATSNPVLPGLLIDVVVALAGLHERAYLIGPNISNHIHI